MRFGRKSFCRPVESGHPVITKTDFMFDFEMNMSGISLFNAAAYSSRQ